ncbi:M13 family metallopeptidase [Vagococcus carniphilus]|uniref:Peptidase M13 n=1 Tax=Vagococcus carniphilus TaxID=218144 RepID=A0A430B7A9_9ENTE|nr:M13-type metalloendopeptidase [Vagococcus carniphilus]QNN72417.1 M13 family peptidase [Vagococcus carniphilus]RSU16137.1 peptidase M13 [Vagococcus carniphilus]
MNQEKLSPKTDFYEYVNEKWLKEAEIPSDKPSINSFSSLADEIEVLLMEDVKKMATGDIPVTSKELQSFKDFYELVSDEETRNNLGMTPIKNRLNRINDLNALSDWSNQLEDWLLSGYPNPFVLDVSSDMEKADTYGVYLAPTNLILPDTTYYDEKHPNKEELLTVYKGMMIKLLKMVGYKKDEAELIVVDCLSFDESLVPFIKSAEESADYTKMYNPKTLEEVANYHSSINFNQFLTALLKQSPNKIIVTEPNYFEKLEKLVSDETFEKMKHWMICSYVLSFSHLLTEDFRQIANQYSLALSGAKEAFSKEKTYFYQATGQFNQVIGQYYAKNYFGQAAKDDVHEMVQQMIQIYQERLSKNEWLEEETKKTAILKLNRLGIHVGYPEEIPSIYSRFITTSKADGGSLIENVEQFNKITSDYSFRRYNQKVDRNEWEMSADTVNAYYHPQKNVIVFPAAILQAPFYDFKQSRSANYGGIGAVIAHEISHAFDNNGAKFDELGNLNDWWTETDLAHFEELTKQMIEQFDDIPFGNSKVNGTLTVSENIADAGGLSCALEAAQLEEDFSGTDLFENWARIWRQKSQEQYIDLLLAVDVHSPNKLRANIQVKNLDEFYHLYDITKSDAMYLEPEKRISIW